MSYRLDTRHSYIIPLYVGGGEMALGAIDSTRRHFYIIPLYAVGR